MYLHRISGENFRVFGSKESGKDLQLEFTSGLNVLVGENDAGKTSVIDAIRHVLLTTSYEFLRIQEHDFHIEGDTRAKSLWLEAESEVRDIMKTATDLATKLTAAPTSWLTPGARTRGFQKPLRTLQTMPSIVPPRTAGRLPMTQRRTLIIRLAHAICEACDEIPIRVITAVVARAWEETLER